jgi:hypothetical protein
MIVLETGDFESLTTWLLKDCFKENLYRQMDHPGEWIHRDVISRGT